MDKATGPFDIFEQELKQVRNLTSMTDATTWQSDMSKFFEDKALNSLFGLFERPLANLIARPLLRRFSNRFLSVMLEEVKLSNQKSEAVAIRVAFDVALLSYMFHTVSEGRTLYRADKIVGLLAKGIWRKVTGKPGFLSVQIRQQLDHYALPWINLTVGAFINAAHDHRFLSRQQANALLSHYWAASIIESRSKSPVGHHPLGALTIHQYLKEPKDTNAWEYFKSHYTQRLFQETKWDLGKTWNEYNSEAWALGGYDPAHDV
ncbi:MAG: hypothetical protein ACR2GW_04800 [Pyrinomonadaceae bacterium]